MIIVITTSTCLSCHVVAIMVFALISSPPTSNKLIGGRAKGNKTKRLRRAASRVCQKKRQRPPHTHEHAHCPYYLPTAILLLCLGKAKAAHTYAHTHTHQNLTRASAMSIYYFDDQIKYDFVTNFKSAIFERVIRVQRIRTSLKAVYK